MKRKAGPLGDGIPHSRVFLAKFMDRTVVYLMNGENERDEERKKEKKREICRGRGRERQ